MSILLPSSRPLRVAVTGSHGLVGSAVVQALSQEGHKILRLVRGDARRADEVAWSRDRGIADLSPLEDLDAVVHLAGESIAGRWTEARKAEIRRSRVEGTQRLCEELARLARRPRVLVSASAIGIYGDRGDEVLREDSAPGRGFLAEVAQAWEAAARRVSQAGVRVVCLRFGMILSAAGGALPKLLLPFRLGLGGRIGSGEQYVSWIALEDVVGIVRQALTTDQLVGALNTVSPNPVANAQFTETLGRALSRPTFLPLPAFAARLALGEMADELLLASQRVVPARLEASGYRFMHPQLDEALHHVLHVE